MGTDACTIQDWMSAACPYNCRVASVSKRSKANDRVAFQISLYIYIYSEGFCVARLLHYDNRETPLAGNFVGRCQGHKSDVSTLSWVLISEKR